MIHYNVIIEPVAVDDLADIVEYISTTLRELSTASKLYHNIKAQILTLSELPKRNRVIEDDRYAALGLRSLIIKNYTAYYFVDDRDHTVHIIRVLYNRREWQNLI